MRETIRKGENMKKTKNYLMAVFAVLSLVVGVMIVPASGAGNVDMTGTWNLEVDSPSGKGNPSFQLKQTGDKLSGTYKGAFGESPVEGTVKGNTFEINFESAGIKIKYNGEVDGDKIKGTLDMGSYGKGTFTGKKK